MKYVPVVDSRLVRGATRYRIPKLVLAEVFQVLLLENWWNYGAGYWMGSRFVERMFDCLGLTNEFTYRVSGYLRVYSERVHKMFDYSRSSNEVGSWSGFGMRRTFEIS